MLIIFTGAIFGCFVESIILYPYGNITGSSSSSEWMNLKTTSTDTIADSSAYKIHAKSAVVNRNTGATLNVFEQYQSDSRNAGVMFEIEPSVSVTVYGTHQVWEYPPNTGANIQLFMINK